MQVRDDQQLDRADKFTVRDVSGLTKSFVFRATAAIQSGLGSDPRELYDAQIHSTYRAIDFTSEGSLSAKRGWLARYGHLELLATCTCAERTRRRRSRPNHLP